MKRRAIALFELIFILIQVLYILPITIIAVDNIGDNVTNTADISNIELEPTISMTINDLNIPTRISFDDTNVLSYRIETEGLTATEVGTDSIEYDIIATDEFGALDLYATYDGNVEVQSSVYTYKSGNKVYISDISQDQAWYDCMKIKYDNGEITLDEFQNAYTLLVEDYYSVYDAEIDDTVSIDSDADIVVNGKLFWEEKTDEIEPLIKAKVELIEIENYQKRVIKTTYTDEYGQYTFELDDSEWSVEGKNIRVRWYLEAETYKLTSYWIINDYYFESPTFYDVNGNTIYIPDYCIPENKNNRHHKATRVHQTMSIAERFALEMGMSLLEYDGNTVNKLNVAYPSISPDYSAGCFELLEGCCVAAIGKNNYGQVDTITHEYGHYVQHVMDVYGTSLYEIVNNWPTHTALEDHFSDKPSKEYAMELTWSEAWACIFSTIAERYYWEKDEYSYLDIDDMYASSYRDYNLEDPFENNYDSYDHDGIAETAAQDNRGEAQEYAVMAFLWDIFDAFSGDESGYDTVELGYQNWWNYTTQSNIYTLEDFVSYMNTNHTDQKNSIAKILAYHKISPIINIVSGDLPVITFTVNGSEAHPNNKFIAYFYDNANNYLGQTLALMTDVAHRSSALMEIDEELWESILDASTANCTSYTSLKISIAGYRYDDTSEEISDSIREESGPYYSPEYTLLIKSPHDYAYQSIDFSSHQCTCADCGHTVTEAHNRTYVTVDNSQHKYICTDCGTYELIGHVADTNYQDPTMRFSRCRYCGALYRNDSFTPIIKDQVTHEETTE